MDVSSPWPTELDLACARSLRRAAARRAAWARRSTLKRVALRTLAAGALASVAFLARPAPVETMSIQAPRPAGSAMPARLAATAASCRIPLRFVRAFLLASRQTGLSPALLSAVAWEESRMDPNAASAAGARGLLQLMPGTAAIVAVAESGPRANVLAGARYLRLMVDRYGGDVELALAAYNAGPTAVDAAGGAPSLETLRYAKNVEARAAALAGCA